MMSAWTESVGHGRVYADELVAAVAAVVRDQSARVVWAHRAWAIVASAQSAPFVVHQPINGLEDLRPTDPPWLHVPGAWEGLVRDQLSKAKAVHTDVEPLLAAMKAVEAH